MAVKGIIDIKRLINAIARPDVSYVIIFVTARCNLLCRHCFYTEEIKNSKNSKELAPDEYEKIAKSVGLITNLNLTGGEPFIRDDLPQIVRAFRNHTGVPFVGITTNGMLRDRIIRQTTEILSDERPFCLKLGVSIDGFQDEHDKIRNRPGGFQEALKTLNALKELKNKHPNLMVYISTTIAKYNKDTIIPFIDFVRKELPVDAHYIGLVRGAPSSEDAKEITPDEYRKAVGHLSHKWNRNAGFFNLLSLANILSFSVNQRILEKNQGFFSCVAGKKMITITEEGAVKPCEILEQLGIQPYIMGNLREYGYDLRKLLDSASAREIRRKITDGHCFCTFECANQASLAFKPKNFLKALTLHTIQRATRIFQKHV